MYLSFRMIGVIAAVPLIYLMMLLARGPTGPTYASFFFGF